MVCRRRATAYAGHTALGVYRIGWYAACGPRGRRPATLVSGRQSGGRAERSGRRAPRAKRAGGLRAPARISAKGAKARAARRSIAGTRPVRPGQAPCSAQRVALAPPSPPS
eukprot:gene8546-14416_t